MWAHLRGGVLNVDQQIQTLLSMDKPKIFKIFVRALLALTILIFASWFYFKNPIPIMLGIFCGLVYFSFRTSLPFIFEAIEAWKSQNKIKSQIQIQIETWSDSDTYIVTVECHQKVWKLMMCQPQGWKPQNEIYHADLYFIEKREWPSLIVCEEGILYPKYRGKLVIS